MPKTDLYTGPWPRKRHSHTCQTCKRTKNQGAVACYKSKCSKPQSVETCQWCAPLIPSVTYEPRIEGPRTAPEVKEIAQWYTLISESQRCAIFSALSEGQRKQAFQYGLAVSWHLLPQYGRDLVTTEWWNNSPAKQSARESLNSLPIASISPVAAPPVRIEPIEPPAAPVAAVGLFGPARGGSQLSLFGDAA